MQPISRKHSTPTVASQVLMALEVGRITRKARAKMRRMYGAGGRRIERIVVERGGMRW